MSRFVLRDRVLLQGNTQAKHRTIMFYRGADKSLARPGRKQATATEDFDISYYFLLVFSPWAGLGRDQSSVRRLVWLWYAASRASS